MLYILKSSRFEIFAFLEDQNFGFLGTYWGYCSQKGDLSRTHIYHHAKFHSDRVTVAEISVVNLSWYKKTYSKLNIRQNA